MYTIQDLLQDYNFYNVISINVKLQINAPQETVWGIISTIDNDQKYWSRIKSIRNISKNQNHTTRELTTINGSKCFQKITLFHREGIHIRWTRGPMVGIKDIMLTGIGNKTFLNVEINYKLSGVVRIVPKSVLEELQVEAEQALLGIKKEAENRYLSYYGLENYEVI